MKKSEAPKKGVHLAKSRDEPTASSGSAELLLSSASLGEVAECHTRNRLGHTRMELRWTCRGLPSPALRTRFENRGNLVAEGLCQGLELSPLPSTVPG